MSLRVEKTFVLEVPLERAWGFLTDPYQVVGCLPGAEITGKVDERTYAGAVTVKVGPVSASYRGRAQFERLDAAAREAELVGRGQDVKGKGGVEMRMVSRLRAPEPGKTEVSVTSEVNISGRLAQFGRGMIEAVADQIFEQFAACVGERLGAAGAAASGAGAAVPSPGATVSGAGAAAPDAAAPGAAASGAVTPSAATPGAGAAVPGYREAAPGAGVTGPSAEAATPAAAANAPTGGAAPQGALLQGALPQAVPQGTPPQGAAAPVEPFRLLPFALRVLRRWLARPFRRGRRAA